MHTSNTKAAYLTQAKHQIQGIHQTPPTLNITTRQDKRTKFKMEAIKKYFPVFKILKGENRPSPQPDASLETFHPFTRLPYELRDQIWRLAQPAGHTPRLIETVPGRKISIEVDSGGDYYEIHRHYANALIPALLLTCSESREIAMKNYEFVEIDSLSTNGEAQRYEEGLQARLAEIFPWAVLLVNLKRFFQVRIRFGIWINFNEDILLINEGLAHNFPCFIRLIEGIKNTRAMSRNLKSVALPPSTLDVWESNPQYMKHAKQEMWKYFIGMPCLDNIYITPCKLLEDSTPGMCYCFIGRNCTCGLPRVEDFTTGTALVLEDVGTLPRERTGQ